MKHALWFIVFLPINLFASEANHYSISVTKDCEKSSFACDPKYAIELRVYSPGKLNLEAPVALAISSPESQFEKIALSKADALESKSNTLTWSLKGSSGLEEPFLGHITFYMCINVLCKKITGNFAFNRT